MSYDLDLDWADRTIDPNDREVQAERRAARKNGRQPPQHPIIPPVASRPEWLATLRMREFTEALAEHAAPLEPQAQVVSLDEWLSIASA